MINLSALKKYLDNEGIPYNESDPYISINQRSRKYKFDCLFLVGITENVCKIHIETSILLPTITEYMLRTINDINEELWYFKFFIRLPKSSDRYTIAMAYDFDINQSTTVQDIIHVLALGCNALEDYYPTIQRQIWR